MRLLSAFVVIALITLSSCREAPETDPVFGASTAASVSPERIAAWNSAADAHRDAGYLTVAQFEATPAASVTAAKVASWDEAASWGNHANAGYVTTAQLTALPAFSITATEVTSWNEAASWGNHASAGYLTTAAFAATAASTVTTTDVTQWDEAFSWGNHASAGYLTTTAFNATPASAITATQVTSWNAAAARTETDPKVGTLTTNTVPRWNGTALADSALVQRGTSIGVGTTSPQGTLSVGAVAHLGKPVPTNVSKSCATAGFSWTNTPSSDAPCNTWCTAQGFAAGVVSTAGTKTGCGGASCIFISDFEACTVGTMQNTGNCNSCAANFVCTCLTPASVFEAEVKVNAYLQLGATTGAPPALDCDAAVERGRMKFDPAANLLWVCTATGWASK